MFTIVIVFHFLSNCFTIVSPLRKNSLFFYFSQIGWLLCHHCVTFREIFIIVIIFYFSQIVSLLCHHWKIFTIVIVFHFLSKCLTIVSPLKDIHYSYYFLFLSNWLTIMPPLCHDWEIFIIVIIFYFSQIGWLLCHHCVTIERYSL